MTSGARHKHQRSARVRLKADADELLFRMQAQIAGGLNTSVDYFEEEIAEMRVRLNPKLGVAAPVILTGYTRDRP